MKRFFAKLSIVPNKLYRMILHRPFIWRLLIEKPKIIILGIDTMAMDNDSSKKREGCEPTYKQKKGFQPLHICWGPYLIDVAFRKGSAHSNHGTGYIDCVTDIVNLIRSKYSKDVPIILSADSGFADQKAFEVFEDNLKIHRSIKELATKEQLPFKSFGMNRAYYYMLVIPHFMFETYKRDITPDVIPVTAYPNTFRRTMIDFAAKITTRSRNIILNVTKTVYETINIEQIWAKCQSPPKIQSA